MGRPIMEPDCDVAELVRSLIRTANASGAPLATAILRQKLAEHGHTLSKWQLLRVLHLLGYYYGRGERRNILHEASASTICKAETMFQLGQKFSLMNRTVIFIILAT